MTAILTGANVLARWTSPRDMAAAQLALKVVSCTCDNDQVACYEAGNETMIFSMLKASTSNFML